MLRSEGPYGTGTPACAGNQAGPSSDGAVQLPTEGSIRVTLMHMAAKKKTIKALEKELRDFAMTYPEATEDFPWSHIAVKVKGKAFVFLGGEANQPELSMTVKLPSSRDMAADLPFAEPSGYGLGKSGWVTARFESATGVPMDLLKAWIDESYRAVAPKKLSKTLPTK